MHIHPSSSKTHRKVLLFSLQARELQIRSQSECDVILILWKGYGMENIYHYLTKPFCSRFDFCIKQMQMYSLNGYFNSNCQDLNQMKFLESLNKTESIKKSLARSDHWTVCIYLFSLFLFLSYLASNVLEEITLIYLNVLFLFFNPTGTIIMDS